MTRYSIFLLFCASVSQTFAQQQPQPSWQQLLRDNKKAEAQAICKKLAASESQRDKVEGYKCYANAELCGAEITYVEANDEGGGTIRTSYPPEVVDHAVDYLNKALILAPQDLSIHQGRLHILEIAARYHEMAKALEESCTVYRGNDALDAWISYSYELGEDRQLKAALELLEVLEKHYPDSNIVLGNIGAMYSMLRQDAKAIEYLKKAVAQTPSDPIDTWNLGRMYDYTDQIALADEWYQKSLKLDTDQERLQTDKCLYAEFVQKKLKHSKRACALQRESCQPEQQTACLQDK